MAQKWLAVNYDSAWSNFNESPELYVWLWQDFEQGWQARFRYCLQQFLTPVLLNAASVNRATTALFELATNAQRHAANPATQLVLELGFVYGMPALRLIDNASPFNGFYHYWAQADQVNNFALHGLGWIKKLFPFAVYKVYSQFGQHCNATYLPFYVGADAALPHYFQLNTDLIFKGKKP